MDDLGQNASNAPRIDAAYCRRPVLQRQLRRLLADVAHDLDAAEATLWTFADNGAWLAAAVNHGPTAAVVEAQRVPVEASIVGLVAAQGLAMAVGPDAWQNATVMEATGTPVRAMVAVPVRRVGEIVGVLSVVNPRGRERFDASALESAAWKATLVEGLLALDAHAD